MALAAVLLLMSKAVTAQQQPNINPTSSDTPITISGITCPANNVTLDPGVDLSAAGYHTLNTTYILKPGTYTMRIMNSVSSAGSLCYVAQGQGVVVQSPSNDDTFSVSQGGKLGLKGFVLQGGAPGSAGTAGPGFLTAEGMVFQGLPRHAVYCQGTCTLRSCSVLDTLGDNEGPVTCYNGEVLLEEVSDQICTTPVQPCASCRLC